jgi:hypothetical protein
LWDDAEKLRCEKRHGIFAAQFRDPADELEAAELVLSVVSNVVEGGEWTVRPSRKHGMIQVEGLDDGIDIVRPQFGVIIGVARLVGETMTSHIKRYKSMRFPEARVHLAIPTERALRDTVDEYDRATLWVPGL